MSERPDMDNTANPETSLQPQRVAETIGSPFPADDPQSALMIRLALISNDLRLTHKWMLEGPHSPGVAGEAQRLYCYALAISQFREAAKAVVEGFPLSHPLITALNPPLQEDYAAVRASCEPWEGSFAQTALKPVRDAIFHYTVVGMKDRERWTRALHEVADEPCEIHEGPHDLEHRWLFADEVRARLIVGCPGDEFSQFVADVQRLRELMTSLVRFCDGVVAEHLAGSIDSLNGATS